MNVSFSGQISSLDNLPQLRVFLVRQEEVLIEVVITSDNGHIITVVRTKSHQAVREEGHNGEYVPLIGDQPLLVEVLLHLEAMAEQLVLTVMLMEIG